MEFHLHYFLPYGAVRWFRRRKERGYNKANELLQKQVKIATARKISRSEITDFLVARGNPAHHVDKGSIPEDSLEFIAENLSSKIFTNDPIVGLHIGNFLGVSLAFLASRMQNMSEKSLIVAVDPNLPHRGINSPQHEVCALLKHFGLEDNVVLLCGFSLSKSISDDGRDFSTGKNLQKDEIDRRLNTEASPPDTLTKLTNLGFKNRFDFALIDGNHEGDYVERELNALRPLLKDGGLIIMDDVDHHWPEIRERFENASSQGFTPCASNGRVGILRKSS